MQSREGQFDSSLNRP
nr:unnamed protein product [Callosobruchus chinensis]